MDYIELICQYKADRIITEILIAELSNIGFEGFVENESGLVAYIPSTHFNEDILNDLYIVNTTPNEISFNHHLIANQNWNEPWESDYQPVIFKGKCAVIAPYHEKVEHVDINIVIEPKMSFGTAHHETTELIINLLFEIDLVGRKVLDMGCGTGVLAILAAELGAIEVTAIDIDERAIKSTIVNTKKNNQSNINVYHGDASLLSDQTFDLIIANINRNILIRDIPEYVGAMRKNSILMLSGFYNNDISDILNICNQHELVLVKNISKNEWAALLLEKLV